MTHVVSHKWEEKGLAAPYFFVTLITLPHPQSPGYANGGAHAWAEAQRYAKSLGVSIASCDICGTSLLNNFICRDASGKHFVVGCDCVEKLGDTFLTTEIEKAERSRQRSLRNAKRQAAWERRAEALERERESQRLRNGGLTDYEKAERERRELQESIAEKAREENSWIIALLESTTSISDWKSSMIHKLKREPISSFSERNRAIFADIYARTFGRANSKAYLTALKEASAWVEVSR